MFVNSCRALEAPVVTNANIAEGGETQHQPHAPIKSFDDELIFAEASRRGRPRVPQAPKPMPSGTSP